jgi:hypothetical protein
MSQEVWIYNESLKTLIPHGTCKVASFNNLEEQQQQILINILQNKVFRRNDQDF